jgi:hypothetical protein
MPSTMHGDPAGGYTRKLVFVADEPTTLGL